MENDVQLTELAPQTVLAIRKTIPMAGVGEFIGPTIGKLYGIAGQAGLTPAQSGSSLALSYGPPTDTIDIAAAVPVEEDAAAITAKLPDDVQVLTLPGGKTATLKYVGEYDGLPAQYQKIGAWVQNQGLTPRYAPWEEYLCGPNCSEEEPCDNCKNGPVTVINWPVS